MSHVARRPHPASLAYITPTQLVDGNDCLWRLGFGRDPAVSTLCRSSPASALGSAAHEVLSKLGEPLEFESVWNEAVSRAQSTLARDWAPATVPSPDSWPGWSLTKVRVRRLWERSTHTVDLGTRPRGPAPKGSGGLTSLPWREKWLEHPHLSLAGRPDLVERVRGEVWVVDLKTGLGQEEPTPAQRSQLLFYCALVGATLGELPSRAAIGTTRTDRYSFVVDDDEVQNVVDQALNTLERFNTQAADGLSEFLAAPSQSACGWCPFRPACRPFFVTYDETWPIAHALLFRVEAVEHSLHGYGVEASVLLPRWRANERVHLLGFPFRDPPAVGEVWGATDFAGRASSAVAAWNTRVSKW